MEENERPQLTAPLMGRGLLMRELEETLAQVIKEQTPRVVTVLGTPGIGKSRVLSEFVKRVREGDTEVRIGRGKCRQSAPAYGAVRRVLQARFGLLPVNTKDGGEEAPLGEDAAQAFAQEVEATLGRPPSPEFLHFLGAYVGLAGEASEFATAVEDDPEGFQTLSRSVLRRWCEADARKVPMVLVIEDLHWASDAFLRLVRYLAASFKDAPILLVCSARPALLAREGDWLGAGGAYHSRLDLGPLGGDDAAALLFRLLEPLGDVPTVLVDQGVEVAGGTPYLLEQVVHAYLDAGVVSVSDGKWSSDLDKLDEVTLPLTVEDAISARISSLSQAERELLEKAATMGSVFWLGALVSLSRVGSEVPALWGGHESLVTYYEQMLADLARRDYVLALPDASLPGEVEYAFKHNLEREQLEAHANPEAQRRFHRVVAEWLEFRDGERSEQLLEMLGHHYERGGQPARAAACLLDAGHRARARYANGKAATYFRRGLALLEEDDDVRRRLEALHAFGDVLQRAGQNEEALDAFQRMLELAYHLDLKAKGGVAHNRIGRVYRSIGHLDDAMRHLGTGQALFDAAGDARGVASSIDDIGKVHWMRGNYEGAERFMVRALDMRREFLATAPEDRGAKRSVALSHNNLGVVYQDSGRFPEAKAAFEQALRIRREVTDRPGVAQTLSNLGTIHQDDGDHAAATRLFEEALSEALATGDRMREAVIRTNLGESRYQAGQPEKAIEDLESAEALSKTLGDRILEGEILRGLAKAHMLIHDHGKARRYIQESIALFEQARAKAFVAGGLRTLGEICTSAGWGGEEHEAARDAFVRSVQIFEELGNEIELAATLEAFARLLETGDANDTADASKLRGRAEAVRRRLHEQLDVQS